MTESKLQRLTKLQPPAQSQPAPIPVYAAKLPTYTQSDKTPANGSTIFDNAGKAVVSLVVVVGLGLATLPGMFNAQKLAMQSQAAQGELAANGITTMSPEQAIALLPNATVLVRVDPASGKRTNVIADLSIEDINRMKQPDQEFRGGTFISASGKIVNFKADGMVEIGQVPIETANARIKALADGIGYIDTNKGKEWLVQQHGAK